MNRERIICINHNCEAHTKIEDESHDHWCKPYQNFRSIPVQPVTFFQRRVDSRSTSDDFWAKRYVLLRMHSGQGAIGSLGIVNIFSVSSHAVFATAQWSVIITLTIIGKQFFLSVVTLLTVVTMSQRQHSGQCTIGFLMIITLKNIFFLSVVTLSNLFYFVCY